MLAATTNDNHVLALGLGGLCVYRNTDSEMAVSQQRIVGLTGIAAAAMLARSMVR